MLSELNRERNCQQKVAEYLVSVIEHKTGTLTSTRKEESRKSKKQVVSHRREFMAVLNPGGIL